MALRSQRFTSIIFIATLITTHHYYGQVVGSAPRGNELQQQYDAALKFQTSGDLPHATEGYRRFLAQTLHRLAEAQAHSGDFPKAAKLFEEALAIAPPDLSSSLHLAYAQAALVARDIPKAKSLAQTILQEDSKNAEARLVLGEALLQTDENEEARKELEAAVALDPNYKNGLALATAYLAISKTHEATHLFAEMTIGFGDKATIHMDFGRAYAEAGYPDLAIAEFNKAIAKDPALPEAHYCLGASYLLSQGEAGFPKAISEFRRELQLHPDDYFSLSQLGYIALSQHRLPEAEASLRHAATLDPRNPDNPLLLGQVYTQLDQPEQAEQQYRQAIALTTDPARNHFQVQRAHYLLGRLLIQAGRVDEGKQEMKASADLLKQNMLRDQTRLNGAPAIEANGIAPLQRMPDSSSVDVTTNKEFTAFVTRVTPAIADSYNNLGAIAAGVNDFATATLYFGKAAKWNPTLEGLDFNWGRAAFAADFYAQAIGPLSRYLATHPQEQGARRVLGVSYFHLKDYRSVVQTLQPIESDLAPTPQLAYMYGQSLVLSGDYSRGILNLQRLATANPSVAEIHRALGEAYADHGNYQQATVELRAALQLNAADDEAKDQLASALVHLEKKGAGVQP